MKKSTTTKYYSFRIQLEKLKHRVWTLVVVSGILNFLTAVISYYLKRG